MLTVKSGIDFRVKISLQKTAQNLISGLQEQSGVHLFQSIFLIIFVHSAALLHSNKRQEKLGLLWWLCLV